MEILGTLANILAVIGVAIGLHGICMGATTGYEGPSEEKGK